MDRVAEIDRQEFVAVVQRRLKCTPQYGALLMSMLAVTARLVAPARANLSPSQRHSAGDDYFAFAQDLLRISQNKLDIRHILALYRQSARTLLMVPVLIEDLAVYAEGQQGSAGEFQILSFREPP